MEKNQIETQVATLLAEYGYDPVKDDYVNIVEFVQHLGKQATWQKMETEHPTIR